MLYHVTYTRNLPAIRHRGLVPSAPEEGDVRGVYLFPDLEAVEDAVMNWLGDKLDDEEPLALLGVDPRFVTEVHPGAGYEVISALRIPPEALTVLSRDL